MVIPMSGRGFHTKKFFWGALTAVLFFFIAAALAAPFLVNSDYVKRRISNTVKSETGIDVSFSEISISFFSGFHIALTGIRTRTDDKQAGVIDDLLVYPDTSSLLQGRLLVTKVVLQDFETEKPMKKPAPEKAPLWKAIYPLSIRDAMVRFAPFIHKDKGIEIVFKNLDTRFFTGADISVRVRSDDGGITGKGRLENLEIKGKSFQSFVPKSRHIPWVETDNADIRFTADEEGRLAGECEFRNLAIHPADAGGLTLKPEGTTATFDISAAKSTFRVKASSLAPVLKKPEISFVRIPGIPSTTLKFSGEKVNIDSAETYANAFFGKNAISRNIFRIIESGVSPKIEVAFENSKKTGLFDPKNLIIQGTIRSGKVNIPESGLTARNVAGSAFMKDGTLDIEVDQGNVENSRIHQGTVSVELLSGPDVPFTARFSLNADLKNAPAILSRLIENEAFEKEMKRMSVSKGSALVDLFLDKKPEKDLTVKVAAKDVRLEGSYDRMHDRIEIFDGSFFYKNKTARIDHVTARSGDSYLYDLCMEFSPAPEPTADIRSGKALFQIKEIVPYLKSAGVFSSESIPFYPQSGAVWIDSLSLTLPFQKKGKQDLQMTGKAKNIQTASGPGKEAACVFSFNFTVSGDRISISKLTGRVKDIQPVVELSGSPFTKGIRTPFEISGGAMEVATGELFFTGKFDFSTGPAVEVSVRRNEKDDFTIEHLSVTDQPATRFDFRNTGKNTDFEGFMNSSTLKKLFTRAFLSQADFFQFTKKNHLLISSDKENFLQLDAYRIDLAPLFNRKKDFADVRKWLKDKPIRVTARYLDTDRIRLDNVSALLDIKADKVMIRLLKGDVCGININGTIVKKEDSLEYRVDASAMKSDNLRQTVKCLFGGEALMDGSFTFQGRFYSKSQMDQLKESVSGDFELSASDGRIYRLTLLSRILSVINISKFLKGSLPDILQDGFAYHTVSVKADVKDSRIVVKEGIIDGTDMSIIFTGDIYPVQKKIDLTFLVAPFKTVDLIVKHIPVLNTLLGGKLVSIPVKAEGSLENPAVIPLHPSAVGTGLTNMLKNIVNAPVKLMEKLP